ncbi:MucR family transcriptional regulator [Sphingomonas melonis]|uniref:MucR family transcriptional regulator n=1 Tax=Sphingomonas melonis TaxID=152682 RepID=UPI001C8B1BDF|nr:MucR family transcriptional regulator [Sphingomonas melonis]MBX8846553.1 MucR family transcriptional regulator [Sphingomonas melonis]MBX8855656.1 MucR family transcriptional regulator [Sphingomonas melonis]
MTDTPDTNSADTLTLAVELTAAWLSNPNTRAEPDAVPTFLTNIHASLATLAGGAPKADDQAAEPTEYPPAVTARKSLASPDRIISMIDGKSYRTLRKHLSTHGLTPDQYRARYNLKPDYPMVAPAYSEARREMAKKIGLGRKPASPPSQPAPPVAEGTAPKPRRRKLGVSIKS